MDSLKKPYIGKKKYPQKKILSKFVEFTSTELRSPRFHMELIELPAVEYDTAR